MGIGSTNSAGNSTGRRINTARKPCNSNAVTSWFERVATELHAKLVVDPAMRDARPGRASRRRAGYHQSTRPHWCGGRRRGRRAWLRCPWAVAGPGRASGRRAEPQARVWRSRGRAAAHGHAKQPGPAGCRAPAHTAAGPSGAPEHPWSRKQPSGTGRCHDPRLGRQRTQSCNPESIRNVGGATRPGHSQGRPDKRNDVLGGPAQAS